MDQKLCGEKTPSYFLWRDTEGGSNLPGMKMVSPLRKMCDVGSTERYPPALCVALRPPLGYDEPSVSPNRCEKQSLVFFPKQG